MKHFNCLSFDISYPEIFSKEQILYGDVFLQNPDEDFEFQQPQISIALLKLEDLRKDEALEIAADASIKDVLASYYSIKRYNITETTDELSEIQNKPCHLQKAISSFELEGKTHHFFHLFATLIIDDTYILDFTADCELKVRDQYEALFLSVLEGIELKGNYQQYCEQSEQEVEDYLQTIEEITKVNEARELEEMEISPFEIPQDNKAIFEVGNYSFDIKKEDTNFYISDYSNNLGVDIHLKSIPDGVTKQAQEEELLNEYIEYVGFDIHVKHVFDNYVPTGRFEFKDGKTNAPLFLHLYSRGFEYGLDFNGHLEFKEGWMGLNGYLKKSYSDTPSYKVKLYCKIDMDALAWSNYQFTYEEAIQAKPEEVRYLTINKPVFNTLPDEMFSFLLLKRLNILGQYDYMNPEDSYSPLQTIPSEIATLTHLENLYIANTQITQLPDVFAELQNLTSLNLVNNLLEKLSSSLFQLANLEYLFVDRNKLSELPEDVDLPSLKSIGLSNNQLKTLPVQLAKQLKLEKIDIQNNPLTHLPAEFNQIKTIELELSEKQRLLDFVYKGADGKGLEAFDNSLYFIKDDPALINQLQQAIKGTLLEEHSEALQHIALKAVCMQTTEEDDYKQLGNSRFGGLPDLPKEISYPTFHSDYYEKSCGWQFIAQINCEEISPYQEYLPRDGILYFFLTDQESFECQLIYAENNNLVSAATLDLDNDSIGDDAGILKPFKAEANTMIALPDFYNGHVLFDGTSLEDFEESQDVDDFYDVYDEVRKKLGVKGIYQEWNDYYYADSHHAINTYVFTQHESPQEQAALVKKGNMEDWVILLKVHSDNNCGFCFWDAGEISFVIHKSDLAKQDFSNVICTLETS